MRFDAMLATAGLALLTACGGGGSSSAPGAELSIGAVTPARIQLTLTDVYPNAARTVTLTAPFSLEATGDTGKTPVYVLVVDPDQIFSQPSLALYERSAGLSLEIAPAVAPGRYTQPLEIHVCKDAACAQEYSGSPQTIPKDVTLGAITLGTSTLSFSSTAGLAPAAQTVSVSAPTSFRFDALGYVTHFDAAGQFDSTSRPLAEVFTVTQTDTGLTLQPRPQAPGRYEVQLLISATDYQPRTLSVQYQVGASVTPAFTLNTSQVTAESTVLTNRDVIASIDFTQDTLVDDWRFRVLDTSDRLDAGWISYGVSYTLGSPAGTPMRMDLRLNTCAYGVTCLPAGTYHATVELRADAFGSSTIRTVPVTFTVR